MGQNMMMSTTTTSTTQTMVTDIGILLYTNTVTSSMVVAPKYYLHNGRSAGAFTFFYVSIQGIQKIEEPITKSLRSVCRVELERVCHPRVGTKRPRHVRLEKHRQSDIGANVL